MTIDEFWNIIDKAKHTQEHEEVVEIIKGELEKLSEKKLISYENHFQILFEQAYIRDLWGALYLIHGACDDDDFMDFIYKLISMGKNTYTNAIHNPDSLHNLEFDDSDIDALFNEEFASIAVKVYEDKTGDDIYIELDELKSTNMGEEWDFEDKDECMKRLPKITEKFWEE